MGPKADTKAETSGESGNLEELIDEVFDLANDVRNTVELGRKVSSDGSNKKIFNLFKARLSRLDSTYEKFNKVYYDAKKAARLKKDDKISQELKQLITETQELYYEALALDTTEENVSLNASTVKGGANSFSLKLPVINLPSFDGDISSWTSFKDTFESLIHNNCELTSVQKFHYLKSCLRGIALQAISAIAITDHGYDQAWQTLTKKFDNKRVQAAHCLAKIFNYHPIGRASLSTLQDFSSNVLENISTFKNLSLPDAGGFILMTYALRLLDARTREKFETEHLGTPEIPTISEFNEFIFKQINLFQSELILGNQKVKSDGCHVKGSKTQKNILVSTETYSSNVDPCLLCKRNHRIYRCPAFLKLTPRQRFQKLRNFKNKICMNCLVGSHIRSDCPSEKQCSKCALNHHTLLHFTQGNVVYDKSNIIRSPHTRSSDRAVSSSSNNVQTPSSSSVQPKQLDIPHSAISHCATGESYVLLGTAIGRIQDSSGSYQDVRILLDNGSQRSFITSSCAKRLGLKLVHNPQTLSGFGNQPIKSGRHMATCYMTPQKSRTPEIMLTAVVTPVITGPMPLTSVPHIQGIFSHLSLADKLFWKSNDIDFLIGADGFGQICNGDIYKPSEAGPYALQTIFGWVIMGPLCMNQDHSSVALLTSISSPPLESILKRFWEIEDVTNTTLNNKEDDACEKHYLETHSRDGNGRYVVRLPFKAPDVAFGNSYQIALRRFYNLEYKLNKNILMKENYNKVLKEYLSLEYMSVAKRDGQYYLPHHGVIKESTSTRLRVVFDASMRTSLGSLNEKLLTGPKLLMDIRVVLAKFRKFPIAIVADIKQMYLQILMHPDDRIFQHILFRFNASDPITKYELNRLTFGLSPAPYLAQRTIRQLIFDEGRSFPLASKVLLESTYMDDILTGAFSIDEALQIQSELKKLLKKGCFELQKWASNRNEILKIAPDISKNETIVFSIKDDDQLKILGMQWDPKTDYIFYVIQKPQMVLTKRAVLSAIARIFDPLGYLAPVVFRAKSFLQKLWNFKLEWDDPIPEAMATFWKHLMDQLQELESIKILRSLFHSIPEDVKLIGFADASSLGYAAVLYLRITYRNSETTVKILTSKTKLAPIKTVSIPRLELCAALLLVRLIETFKDFLNSLNITSRYMFSDSSVVLSWLRLPPNTLKVFVANRVSEIITLSDVSDWYHVNTRENPADMASRGLAPKELVGNNLWWHGPQWLLDEPSRWPVSSFVQPLKDIPEQANSKIVLVSTNPDENVSLQFIHQFSTLDKLISVTAYVQRFIYNIRTAKAKRRVQNFSSRQERYDALLYCIKVVQKHYFSEELELVMKDQGHKSKLKSLAPFVDSVGVLRVGGRLSQSPLHYDARHPIILPGKSHLSTLIIDHLHIGYLHAGPTLLLSLLQRHYWIIGGRRVVKQRIRLCIKCSRQKPQTLTPYMADLPPSRFEQGRAFINVGVDYAGPFLIKESKLRKARVSKCYMCIFVCLSTKAVHLDLVSDLTTDAFLACLDRFIARRGIPSKIFSDHGTNFVGADRYLKELYQLMQDKDVTRKINNYMVNREICWEYSPPLASHMSGLWEAGVKSAKSHINRVLVGKTLTFEELSTFLARVEAILNSRPLYPKSSDPDDYTVLTPGHFLIGDALVAPPEYDFSDVPLNRLSRWQLLSQCLQRVWSKWRLDYLNSLQQRVKWFDKTNYENLTPGTLVLLKEANVAPTQWPTARVVEVYPGKDNIVRVVKVKTSKGEFVRPVAKMALLLPTKF